MKSQVALVLALFFVAGAYASFLPDWTGFYTVFGIGFGLSLVVPAIWRLGPKRWVYLLATLIAVFACFYVRFRTPQPQTDDISKYAPLSNVIVRGKVVEAPSLTRSDRAKFLLEVKEINPSGKLNIKDLKEQNPDTDKKFTAASGKLYVTVPLIVVTGLRAGQA
ncbi:MAG: DUF4131 domain-containing protein, partial [Pseudanabaena sp. CAN_BIN31]|nr:DUF4131 domain-containing protein [Pseudanabaena sp. CAN_BIN31]